MNVARYEKLLKHAKPISLILFISMVILGIYCINWYYEQYKEHETVYAVCEKVLFKEQRNDRSHSVYYVCELGYDYNGVHYVATAGLKYTIRVGDKVKLRIDPQNPSRFIFPPSIWVLVIAMIVIPIIMIVVIGFFFDSNRPDNSDKTEEIIKE